MENINEQFKRLFCELDLTDDQAAMIRKLQRDVDAALRQPLVIGSVCDGCGSKFDAMDIKVGVCYCCQKEIKQTDL
jgi:hypothetical protein